MNEMKIRADASDCKLKNIFAEVMLDDGVRLKLALYYKGGEMTLSVTRCFKRPLADFQTLKLPLFEDNNFFDELLRLQNFIGQCEAVLPEIFLFMRSSAEQLQLPEVQRGELVANISLLEKLSGDDFALKHLRREQNVAWRIEALQSEKDNFLKSAIGTMTSLFLLDATKLDESPEIPDLRTVGRLVFDVRNFEALVHELERRKNLPPQDGNGDSAGCPTGLPFKEVGVSSM
ncbi:hypothetical protein [Falsiruegeria mediterranea]|uniref:Uncharacterized protein n=1 Tax=Falsiruegeria mediterranea M17 TaxID=1200281 RepID=A0A2R8CAC1_9RHOB|nr:hypothetical protein [Falsiruegeria mediterranea]SPJ29394.1 hypothetical protein TRM7615_02912 [Falsiruegeria mediterranea M17]